MICRKELATETRRNMHYTRLYTEEPHSRLYITLDNHNTIMLGMKRDEDDPEPEDTMLPSAQKTYKNNEEAYTAYLRVVRAMLESWGNFEDKTNML
jgi:hypothetical protein